MQAVVVKKFRIFRTSMEGDFCILFATSEFSFPDSSFPSQEEAENAIAGRAWDLVNDDLSFVIVPYYFAIELEESEVKENPSYFLTGQQ